MPYRQKKGKEKERKSEKENEKKAERSTVKMYYWNVALSEHCEDVPLESGSVHWSTAKMYHCEDVALRRCTTAEHCEVVALSNGALRISLVSQPTLLPISKEKRSGVLLPLHSGRSSGESGKTGPC